jgi:hypothetical protein
LGAIIFNTPNIKLDIILINLLRATLSKNFINNPQNHKKEVFELENRQIY